MLLTMKIKKIQSKELCNHNDDKDVVVAFAFYMSRKINFELLWLFD